MTARNQGRKATIEEGDVASPLFKSWAKKYKNTATYQECMSKCPQLRAFLGLNDPAE